MGIYILPIDCCYYMNWYFKINRWWDSVNEFVRFISLAVVITCMAYISPLIFSAVALILIFFRMPYVSGLLKETNKNK